MAGIKRKSGATSHSETKTKSKKAKVDKPAAKHSGHNDAVKLMKKSKTTTHKHESDGLVESDTSEEDHGFYGFSANKNAGVSSSEAEANEANSSDNGDSLGDAKHNDKVRAGKRQKEDLGNDKAKSKETSTNSSMLAGLNATSSREAHAKQKALAKERRAAKPNADIVEQAKKLWELLRLKSHTKKEERTALLDELFGLVTGRVKDLVFKHDSVRVIQTAIKYSVMEQKRSIARELKGEFKSLAEGKYSKFLIAKLIENGDPEISDMIISEFYGHVRHLLNHPEAAWILDDTYRQAATPEQKTRLLREWYGPEFSVKGLNTKGPQTSDLSVILKASPEKRKPIMEHLEAQINQLINKKLTGFTMLHDAMLQYFLACEPGTSQATDFLNHLKPDTTAKEGDESDNVDLLKNLAFTNSGSRLVSLAFAYGSAKDRKALLKPYKDTIEMMAYDTYAHYVLLAALAVTDDTKNSSKSIFSELLPTNDKLLEKIQNLANDPRARTVLLYPFAGDARWLFAGDTPRERLSELHAIRATTSKKDPNTRLQEIVKAIEPQLLGAVAGHVADFMSSNFALQFLGEVLIGAPEIEPEKRKEALVEIVGLSEAILESSALENTSHGKNMLKTLVLGGKFDRTAGKVVPVEPYLGFADMFWDQIKDNVLHWATGQGSFVIVGLTEAEGFERKEEVLNALRKSRKELEAAAGPEDSEARRKKRKGGKAQDEVARNAGTRILLEKL